MVYFNVGNKMFKVKGGTKKESESLTGIKPMISWTGTQIVFFVSLINYLLTQAAL